MKIGLISLGCPKNLVDSEVMLGLAHDAGHELTRDPADAEVLVVNTCAFIDSAKQESVDAILEMAQHKKDGRCQRLIVTGCLAERYRDEPSHRFPRSTRIWHWRGAGDRPGHWRCGQFGVAAPFQLARAQPRIAASTASRRQDLRCRHAACRDAATHQDRRGVHCGAPDIPMPALRSRPADSDCSEARARGVKELSSSRRTPPSTASIARSGAHSRLSGS